MSSITTMTGDDGTSGLLYGARESKTSQRYAALGALDELQAALGLARASAAGNLSEFILGLQKELFLLGAELACLPKDIAKAADKLLPESAYHKLHDLIKEKEAARTSDYHWQFPGTSPVNAALHLARAAARRAEREFWILYQAKGVTRTVGCVYLNRLSDLLWLLADANA